MLQFRAHRYPVVLVIAMATVATVATLVIFIVVFSILALRTLLSIHRRRSSLCSEAVSSEMCLSSTDSTKFLVVLGSGGHSAEMLSLLADLLPYVPPSANITYVAAATDHHSLSKAKVLHQRSKHTRSEIQPVVAEVKTSFETLPRAREVGQPWMSSILTSTRTSAAAFRLLWRERPHVVLCNGPGTCAVVAVVAFVLRVLTPSIFDNRVVYVESFARVETLSLSGKILYWFSDRFVVQWRQLQRKWPRSEFFGRLC